MSLQSITEDQYYLASRAHISISESNDLADFEREAFVNILIRDVKEQAENQKVKK